MPRKSKLKTADGIHRRYERGDDITNIDTSELVSGEYMFLLAHAFNQDISGWDVSSMETARYMFTFAKSFNQPIGKWDVSKLRDAEGMFHSTHAFNQDISDWDLPLDCDCSYMFNRSGMPFIAEYDGWQLRFIQFKNSILIQAGCRYFRTVEAALAHWNPKTHRNPERANLFSDAIHERAYANLRD